MKSLIIFSRSLPFIFLLIISPIVNVFSQTKWNIVKSNIEVDGTSTLHDWEMKTLKATGSAAFVFNGNKISAIQNAQLIVKVNDLKSESSGLDKNAYNAMNASANPQIIFTSSDVNLVSSDGINYSLKLSGKLSMSGVTKALDLTGTGKLNSDKSFSFSGSKKIDMTLWGIKPPSFMMGAMKTGKEIIIKYTIIFK